MGTFKPYWMVRDETQDHVIPYQHLTESSANETALRLSNEYPDHTYDVLGVIRRTPPQPPQWLEPED